MSKLYTCQGCGLDAYPDSLYPIRIELPRLTGTQVFLVCKDCYDHLFEKMETEVIKFADDFQEPEDDSFLDMLRDANNAVVLARDIERLR